MPLATVSPAKLTSTFIKKLEAANFNYVITVASKNITQGGKTGGGEWIDVIASATGSRTICRFVS